MSKNQVPGGLFHVTTCILGLLGTALALSTDCIELKQASGILESPGSSSGSYSNNLDVCWKITVPRDKYVLLKHFYFELEEGKPCKDWLKVSESEADLPSSRKLCGKITEFHMESKDNTFVLQFQTNSNITAKGFKLKWTSINNVKKCEDMLSDCSGWASDGYCDTIPTAMEWSCRKSCNKCENDQIKKPPNIECGIQTSPKVNRIHGGRPVQAHKYPWQVGLRDPAKNRFYHCGGTIINSDYILTAAHCFYKFYHHSGTPDCELDDQHLQIGVADSNQHSPFDDGFIVYAEKTIIHPKYNCSNFDYDLALLKLEQSLEFEHHPYIRPICLPENDGKTYENMVGFVSGWGKVDGGHFPDLLQETEVKILDVNCSKLEYILPSSMCAGWPGVGEKDSCQGDSGGPLMVSENDHMVQVGVVSGGKGCGFPSHPGIYARVSKALDWITTILQTS